MRQGALVLQHQGGGGGAQRILLLFSVQRLVAQVDRSLGRRYAGPVLLHGKLRVAHFNANLVFHLLQTHLRLAIFQFGTNLRCLGHPVAQRNVQS